MCVKFIYLQFFIVHLWGYSVNAEEIIQNKTLALERRYHVVRVKLPQPKALEVCKSFGMDLVSIHDKVTNEFLKKLVLESGGQSGAYWTSARKNSSKDQWRWSDGRTFSYTNWADGEPNDNISGDYCIQLLRGHGWNDHDCKHDAFFICEGISQRKYPDTC